MTPPARHRAKPENSKNRRSKEGEQSNAHVSTEEQHLDAQISALEATGAERICRKNFRYKEGSEQIHHALTFKTN